MKYTPLVFESIDPTSIALKNNCLGKSRQLQIELAGESLRICSSNENENFDFSEIFEIALGEQRVMMAISNWNALPGMSYYLEGVPLEELPEGVATAVVEAILDEQLERLSESTGARCEVVGRATPDMLESHRIQLGFQINSSNANLSGRLWAHDAFQDNLSNLLNSVDAVESLRERDINLHAHLEIGMAKLSVAEIEQVQMHDVILFQPVSESFEQAVLTAAGRSWLGEFAMNQFRFLGAEPFQRDLRLDEPEPSLLVTVRKASTRMSLEQLKTIQSGTEICLEPLNALTLCAQEKQLALGELVRFGDRLGFRVTELAIA
ncbi:MAG: FliM/FliN family flagellar motor switch protein [Planctomycetota bacterium]